MHRMPPELELMSTRRDRLQAVLTTAFEPQHVALWDESHGHGRGGQETHLKVVLVSDHFVGLRPVARHQRVYALCQEELAQGLHALALHLYTPEEWALQGAAPDSPACRGGHD